MAARSMDAQRPLLGTPSFVSIESTIFITNLHCSSCISLIKACLGDLSPDLQVVTYSVVSHAVIIRRPQAISAKAIRDELDKAGFEVYGIFQGSDEEDLSLKAERYEQFAEPDWHENLERAVSRWKRAWTNSRSSDSTKRRRHIENCSHCRQQASSSESGREGSALLRLFSSSPKKVPTRQGSSYGTFRSETSPVTKDAIISIKDSPESQFGEIQTHNVEGSKAETYKATLSISGMTCSSCQNSVTHALQSEPWVISADVNLLSNSATVMFQGEDRSEALVELVDDAGFDATVNEVVKVSPAGSGGDEDNKWEATFAIDGMTCSSCSGTITRALQELSFLEHVSVNLMTNTAVVILNDKSKVPAVQSTIDEVGYGARLEGLRDLQAKSDNSVKTVRKISLQIDGMYCEHCPQRVSSTLQQRFPRDVTIKKLPDPSDPILTLEYEPEVPSRTIRSVIEAVSSVDSAFEVSVYHPPTIEDRARDMQVRERRRILFRLLLCLIVAIPTFLIGIVYMSLVSDEDPIRHWLMQPALAGYVSRMQWTLFLLATPIYFFAADIFHRRAMKEVRAMWKPGSRTPILQRFTRFGSMNMLMSLGNSIAYFASVAELSISASGRSNVPDRDYYFDSVVFLTMFILAGRYLEAYSKFKTGDAVNALGKLRPAEAILFDAEKRQDRKIPSDLLEVGDTVRVHHGASPPFDGTVIDGSTRFDESSLTGESRPVDKNLGDDVFSGTINQGSSILVRIFTVSGTSMLDQIIQVVREGQTRRAPVERVADRITSHFVPSVILIGVLTWLIWLLLGVSGALPDHYRDSSTGGWPLWSLRFAIAVIVVSCPCGIGLAAPTALFVGGQLAARHGILVKGGGEAFQEGSNIDCIVFDKTGTLTEGGEPAVTDHIVIEESNEKEIYGIVASLEGRSSHPIATALASFCTQDDLFINLFDTKELPGKGMKGTFKPSSNSSITSAVVGNEALMADYKINVPSTTTTTINTWKNQGKSVALAAVARGESSEYHLSAAFAISDPLRPEALPTIKALQSRGIAVWMLSGDNVDTARAVGAQLNIPADNIIAGVLPDQKAEKIKYLQSSQSSSARSGRRATIAMVGDGINDAPALAHADVSIAIGSGSAIALSSASFILVSSNLTSLLTLLDLSRVVFRRVYFNFAWALVYNLIAMPIAAGVFYSLRLRSGEHVRLDPVWASLAMALSSLSVVGSSALLGTGWWGVGFRSRRPGE